MSFFVTCGTMNWKKPLKVVLLPQLPWCCAFLSGITGMIFWKATFGRLFLDTDVCSGGRVFFHIRAARWRIILLSLGKPVRRIDTFNGVDVPDQFCLPGQGSGPLRGGVNARDWVLTRSWGLLSWKGRSICCAWWSSRWLAFLRMDVFRIL